MQFGMACGSGRDVSCLHRCGCILGENRSACRSPSNLLFRRVSALVPPCFASYRGQESFPEFTTKGVVNPKDNFRNVLENDEISIEVGKKEDSDDQVEKLISVLPEAMHQKLESHGEIEDLLEIVMDLGRPPLARFPSGDFVLSESVLSREELEFAVKVCGEFGGDNRAGIDGTLHRISAIRNRNGDIVGLTCRVGRARRGAAAMIVDQAKIGRSILFLGRPGVGKTTVIRELSRYLADDLLKRVVIVDTSNEIGGDGDIPHSGIGRARRMQVPDPSQQHRVMIEAVENHTPEVIVIDEIGTEAEALAARTIAQRGVQLIATAHGNEMENIMKNPSLSDLIGGIASVTLGDDEAKRRGVQKSILERESPPTFDVAVEMISRNSWRVHLDVAHAVDALLLGREAGAEAREKDVNGKIWTWPEDYSVDFKENDGEMGQTRHNKGSKGASGKDNQYHNIETQPFPEAALLAARGQTKKLENVKATGIDSGFEQGDGVETRGFIPTVTKAQKSKSSRQARKEVADRAQSKKALNLFLYGIDSSEIDQIIENMDICGQIVVVDKIQEAHAILATRQRLKSSGWIRTAAQAAQIPVFSVRSSAVENLMKGLRTLTGVDPSPGNIFPAMEESDTGVLADPRNRPSRQNISFETNMQLLASSMQENDASGKRREKNRRSDSSKIRDCISEARVAIESIVIPVGQPVDLMPCSEDILQLQVDVAKEHQLPYEIIGSASKQHLRIFPFGFVPATVDKDNVGADEAYFKKTKNKEYW